MLPAPSTIVVLQAQQGIIPEVGAGEEVCVRLSLCVGFFIDKGRPAPLPESTETQEPAHSCTTCSLLIPASMSDVF